MLKDSAQRVQDALKRWDHHGPVRELKDSAHTAHEAASALHADIAQIVKSLVFQGTKTQSPYLLLVSGAHRVDLAKVELLVGEPVRPANPDWVKSLTGFTVGGIPPIAHDTPIPTLIDEHLLHFSQLWAAAGHPHAVFPCSADDLARMTSGLIADIHQAKN